MRGAPLLAAGVALIVATAPSLVQAQTQTSSQSAATPKEKDPNRIICERVDEIGSRLSSTKVCMTAQQWEEKRIQERQNMEDVQRRQTEPHCC
jgi:hypothetical protein